MKQTVASGREAFGSVLSTAQTHLQKVFIVFVIGFIGTFWLLRVYIWSRLQADLNAHPDILIIAITPFEVILLQAKIGLVAGILLAIPALVYFSRHELKARGRWPKNLPRWKLIGFAAVSAALFTGGVVYAYVLFFPLMFGFLAQNAVGAGLQPNYSISMWAQFIFLLALSFGLAAQLPLLMSTLAYSEIVQYETFRDKWKYAVVGIFVFGAFFSPPDPFTQIMWAVPLITLYAASLYITKIVVTAKRSRDSIDVKGTAKTRWNVLAGLAFVGGALVYAFYTYGGVEAVNSVLAAVGSSYRVLPAGQGFGVSAELAIGVFGALYGLVLVVAGLAYFVYAGLEEDDDYRYAIPGGTPGDPADIDLSELDEAGIRAAPATAFARLEEDEALSLASDAMADDDPDLAQAILDRYDDVNPPEVDVSPKKGGGAPADADMADDTAGADGADDTEEEGGILARRGAGMLSAFREDDVDEDDIGGYAYDIAFVFDSLTSKSFRLVGLAMSVMGVTFYLLYAGGIERLNNQFVSRMPDQFAAEQVSIVTLHPVEALIFMVKVAVIFGVAATLPLLLYYAWPALKERGFARGDRRVLLVWGGMLISGMAIGSVLGFIYVAPAVISWLAADVLRAEMVISYRINNYGWLVFFLTVGIGILAMIPVSMFLFHRGGIVPYRTMRARWREFTIAVLAIGAIASPRGVFTMFILGIPIVAAYAFGLGVLWLYTFGGRRVPERAEPAD